MEDQKRYIDLIERYIANLATPDEISSLIVWITREESQQNSYLKSELLFETINDKSPDVDPHRREELRLEAQALLKRMQKRPTLNPIQRLWRVAAVAIIVVTLSLGGYFVWNSQMHRQTELQYTSYENTQSVPRLVELPDGSIVTLNAQSSIKIDNQYNDTIRRVTLVGQALFEVKPNKTKPFIVAASQMSVRVLGTTFDVKSYADEQQMSVTVVEGKVLVDVDIDKLRLPLTTSRKVVINRSTGEFDKITVDERNAVPWVKGMLCFEDELLVDVVRHINRVYNSNVVIEGTVNSRISGMHDNKSLEAVLDAICYTSSMQYRRDSTKIIIFKTPNKK